MATFQKRGGKWRALVRKKGHPTQTKTFSTKGIAQRWAREIERDIDLGIFQDPRQFADITLSDLVTRYRDETKEIGRTKDACLGMLDRELGAVRVSELTKARILTYAKRRTEKHRAGPATLAQDFIYLRGLLDTARAHWDIPTDVLAVTDARAILARQGLIGKSRERDRRPDQDELEALHAYWDRTTINRRAAPMWDITRFLIASCMRLSEVMRIRWDDLNEADRTILIRSRKHPSKKLGNDQTVPLLGDAFKIAMAQPRGNDRIFPYNPRSISSNFTRAVLRCRVDDLHLHDLRHEGISRLFEAGYQIHEVALVSGHRDWKQLKRYTQIRAKDLHR